MAIVRVHKTSSDQYTTLLNATFQENRLSLAAKGMLLGLLSKPKNWNINVNFLAVEYRLNRKTVYKLINELIAFGYCTRRKFNNGHVEYTLYEVPQSEKRDEAHTQKRIKESQQLLKPKPPQSEKASFHFLGHIEKKERTIESKDSPSPPTRAREEELSPQPGSAPREPKTPHDWAQYFIERCGYRIDQAITPKAMAMFRQWMAEGITLEDVEDAALVAEARLNGYPTNPTFYRKFVEEVVLEKQRAKENPAATRHSKPGSYKSGNNRTWRPQYEKNRPISQRKLSAAERAIELEREYYRLRGEPDPYPRAERELFDITPECLRIN